MTENDLPPTGCTQWKLGEQTTHPPEDDMFLRSLVEHGFLAFTGPGGLLGAKSGNRQVTAIHRGKGIRWHIFFAAFGVDEFDAHICNLGGKSAAACDWLHGKPLVEIKSMISAHEW